MVGYDINADNKQKKLFYQTESRGWEEALPIGNGRIGAMVFGGSLNDRIQINEETLCFIVKSYQCNVYKQRYGCR